MTKEKKYLYVKFHMDQDAPTMKSMFLSEDRNAVESWAGASKSKKPGIDEKPKKDDDLFLAVARDFENSINTFQTSIPFIMRSMPLMRRLADDITIRRYVAKNGEQLEIGEFEFYKIDINHGSHINELLQDSNLISLGISSLPTLSIMGLVSSYDVFLAKLIRAIFLTKPELLSSSERNISFKDLVDFGSVEAARDNIME